MLRIMVVKTLWCRETSGQIFDVNICESEVTMNAHAIDHVELSDSVPVLQQMGLVHSHLKFIMGAEDLQLKQEKYQKT